MTREEAKQVLIIKAGYGDFVENIIDQIYDDFENMLFCALMKPIAKEKVHNDWRLPTIDELKTLVNYNKGNPACDLEDTDNYDYWSATTYTHCKDYAWSVFFGNGSEGANYKTISYYVRCVRDGEIGLEWSKTSKEEMSWYEAIEYAKNLEAEVYYKGE